MPSVHGAPPMTTQRLTFEIQLGSGSTSNVARVPVNPQHETITALGGSVALAQAHSRFEYAALGMLEYQNYQGDVFSKPSVSASFT